MWLKNLVIDIDIANFSVKRSGSGNECSVLIDYDDENYDVSLKFNKKKNQQNGFKKQ